MPFGSLFGTSAPAAPEPTDDGSFVAPSRTARDKCWAARDDFFACLDKHGIIDATNTQGKADSDKFCGKQDSFMQKECVASWVPYFKQRRIQEHKKALAIKEMEAMNAQKLPDGAIPDSMRPR